MKATYKILLGLMLVFCLVAIGSMTGLFGGGDDTEEPLADANQAEQIDPSDTKPAETVKPTLRSAARPDNQAVNNRTSTSQGQPGQTGQTPATNSSSGFAFGGNQRRSSVDFSSPRTGTGSTTVTPPAGVRMPGQTQGGTGTGNTSDLAANTPAGVGTATGTRTGVSSPTSTTPTATTPATGITTATGPTTATGTTPATPSTTGVTGPRWGTNTGSTTGSNTGTTSTTNPAGLNTPRTTPSTTTTPPATRPSTSLPAGVQAAYVSPSIASRKTHEIKSGDNFSALAKRFYGSERYAKSIAEANPLLDPTKLQVGDEIRLPTSSELLRRAPSSAASSNTGSGTTTTTRTASVAGRKHMVHSGDTLSSISKRYYGKASLWRVIHNANRDVLGNNPNRLPAGETLVIPPKPAD